MFPHTANRLWCGRDYGLLSFFYLFVMVTIAATTAQRCDVAMIMDTEKPRDTLISQVSIRLRRQSNKQDARRDCLQLRRETANIIQHIVKWVPSRLTYVTPASDNIPAFSYGIN